MAMFGDTLRQARAHKGVTLKEAEHATRINRHHLAGLEDENFDALPPLIYQRGIVRNYAAYLGLDANKLLSLFEEANGIESHPTEVIAAVRPLNMPSHWAPNFAIIAFMVVMVAVVFAWLYSAYFAQTGALPTATENIATVTPYDTAAILPTTSPSPEVSPTSSARSAGAPDLFVGLNQSTNVSEVPPTKTPVPPKPTLVPTDPPVEPEPVPVQEEPADPPAIGDGVTSVTITAEGDINVTLSADGVTMFDGYLALGESTGPVYGSTFEAFSSNGAQTLFTNGCGSDFYMGYGANETYYLTAQPCS
ncbi:MAG: helix-turn-helix domain-containing protein [Chloroflexota bacterium]|nr:helix-turn-helix domain-containing protein [Chloroflexota bacterium]